MEKNRDSKGRFVTVPTKSDRYTFWGTRKDNPLDFTRILREAEEDGREFLLVTMAGSSNAVVGTRIKNDFISKEKIYLAGELLRDHWGTYQLQEYRWNEKSFQNTGGTRSPWRFRQIDKTDIKKTILEIEAAIAFHEKKFQTRKKTTVKRW